MLGIIRESSIEKFEKSDVDRPRLHGQVKITDFVHGATKYVDLMGRGNRRHRRILRIRLCACDGECYWGHRSESAIRQAKQRDSISRKYRRYQIQAVMSVRGVAHLTTARGTSSEEATINPNSLEVLLRLPQIHTSQTGQIKNKKPAKPYAIAGLCFLRTGMDRYLVPGTGLEPASQLRRRIFVTLLLSKPTSSERHRSCAGLCLRRRARACC